MILETLDIKQNDVFIYSENKFDLENNFRMISKDEKYKKALPIHFNDVCKYINSSDPKTVIVYRLLTNLSSFQTEVIKYGVMIIINGEPEVIHFDPVFAIKELEEYVKSNQITDVRFRIQQVGLLSQISNFGKPNYSEVYAFDLEVVEAKYQNDKVFAELIFAFDEVAFDATHTMQEIQKIKIGSEKVVQRFKKVTVEEVKNDLIEEDINFDAHKMRKLTYLPMPGSSRHIKQNKAHPETTDKFVIDKQTLVGKTIVKGKADDEKSFASFIKNVKTDTNSRDESKDESAGRSNVIDLFKSSQHVQQYVVGREQKHIVLKLKAKDSK